MKARLIIVDENARRDVHGIHEAKPLPDTAVSDAVFDLGCDFQESSA
jgi:hypothetical protein